MSTDDVIVCGGGIGGLSAAAALARMGIRSLVLEQAEAFGEIGAGIQLAPNAFRALDKLGITDALRGSCVFIDDLKLMSAPTGEEITRIPLDDRFLNRFGFPYAVVHRAEFHRILLDLCRTSDLVSFRLKSKLVAYDQTDRHVEVLLADGTRLRGTALIGADGLHSAVRRQLCGDGAPLVSGKSTYRTLIAADDMPEQLRWNAGVLWAGPKVHAVHYPLSGSRKLNLVANCVDGCTVAHRGSAVDADVVQACFAGMAPELQHLIARGRDWRHWVLCDRAPITRWVDHRVALLGDAAHPMLQYFAQGACMAIEDALILAQSLADHPDDPPAGLDAYQHQRHVRTARVQRMSRSVGDYICHASGGLAAYRDRILARRTPERWHDVLEWIYGADGQGLSSAWDSCEIPAAPSLVTI